MGGGSGRKTELGKLDHGGRWRDEQEWPLARARADDVPPHGDGSLTREPRRDAEPRHVHLRPGGPRADDRRQLLRRRRVPGAGRGHGADVDAPAQPGAAAAEHHDPGPRRPEGVRGVLHRARAVPAALGAAPTCSSTRPSRSREPVEVTGRARRRAADLVVRGRHRLHREADRRLPAERGLPGGLRHADQRLDHPLPLPQRLRAGGADGAGHGVRRSRSCCRRRRTCSRPGHRIRIDVSSSNFPRLERNPNTGEPIGRHTHEVVAEQTVHGGTRRAAGDPCVIDWVADPGRAVPDGERPGARAIRPTRTRRRGGSSRSTRSGIGARAGHGGARRRRRAA